MARGTVSFAVVMRMMLPCGGLVRRPSDLAEVFVDALVRRQRPCTLGEAINRWRFVRACLQPIDYSVIQFVNSSCVAPVTQFGPSQGQPVETRCCI